VHPFEAGFSGGLRGTSTRRLLRLYFPYTLSTLPVIIATTPILNSMSEPWPDAAYRATSEKPASKYAQATTRIRSIAFMPTIQLDRERESRRTVALVLDIIAVDDSAYLDGSPSSNSGVMRTTPS
jgi:hypothetical protein